MTIQSTMAWEYKTVPYAAKPTDVLNDGDTARGMDRLLAEHGAGGWELVSAAPVAVGSGLSLVDETKGFLFVFKRPSQ